MRIQTETNKIGSALGDGSQAASDDKSEQYPRTRLRFTLAILLLAVPLGSFGQTIVPITATPTSGIVPLSVNFNVASVDSGGNALTNWNWDFGDGSTSTLESPSYTYRAAGSFHPRLTATNNLGGAVLDWNFWSTNFFITASPPTIQFTATPARGAVPLAVQFTATNRDSAGNAITCWNWSFGDGYTSTAQNPSHTYFAGGSYQPGLMVTNSRGTQIFASGPGVDAAAYTGLVLNGGFETGDFFGWTLIGQTGLYNLVDTFYQSTEGMEPHGGSYFARLGQTGSLGRLTQSLATTAGAKYLLSFWLSSPDGRTPNRFLAAWNGGLLLALTNLPAIGNDPALAWTNFQFVVTATGAATILQFGFEDDPTALGLDDISVIPAPVVEQPASMPYGHSYSDWSVAWWQWGLGLPTNGHPFTVTTNFDVIEGQTGPVWFLAMPDGTHSRACTIPDGKALFFALPVSEWSSLEGFPTETAQRANATLWGAHIVNPYCVIDGLPVQNIGSYRVASPQFTFTAPTPWIYGGSGGVGTAVADGYYLFLDPLAAGQHTLHYGGGFHFAVAEGDAFNFDDILDMTYNLTVAPASVSLALQGTNLMVSWPQTTTSYVLEQSDSLSPANWSQAGSSVQPTGSVYQVLMPMTQSNRFFRLLKR